MPSDQPNLAANPDSVYQEGSRRILEPGVRQHEGPRRVRILALVEFHDLAAVFLVFRERLADVDRRADPGEREHASDRFAMHPNAAMGVRIRMDKALVKSVGGFEFLPVRHGITG